MIASTSGTGRRTACSKHCVKSRSRVWDTRWIGQSHFAEGDEEEVKGVKGD